MQQYTQKPSTAQSRLRKYPKKCEEQLNKVTDDHDYITGLELYIKNLNLSEPYYDFMVNKEKCDGVLELLHVCTIKVNEKYISSSFPVECFTIENAKNVAAKHALLALKNQYGEVNYPITNDINLMASRIKNFLKLKYEENGIICDVLKQIYREEFQENLPDNWVQLLEVYSYFTFDKLVADNIIIYLNTTENIAHHNHHNAETNKYLETIVEEPTIVPNTPLMIKDYDKKSVLVSAVYCSTSVWIRFVGESADAIECSLTQLENFSTFHSLKKLLDEIILNKTFSIIFDSKKNGCGTRITLFEENGLSNKVNINEIIIQQFLEKSVIGLPAFEENAIVDGTVSAIVVESGYVYLQLRDEIILLLEDVLPNDESISQELFLKNKEDIDLNKVYLSKYEADDLWSRVQVLEFNNDSEVKIIYIDYGNIAKCEITKLADLNMFDPLMAKIPPQAIKVTMYLLPPSILTQDIASKIFEIIGNDKVLVSLIHGNDIPCVQLFKARPDISDTPLCINMQIAQSLNK